MRAIPFTGLAGVAAFGFAGLIVLARLIAVPAGLPTTGAEIAEVIGFFSGNDTAASLSSAVTPAAWVLATAFGAGAVIAVRGSVAEGAWLGFGGLLLQNSAFAGVVALRLALGRVDPAAAVAGSGHCTTRCSPSTARSWR